MTFFSQILATVIGFSVIMLILSLIITYLVRGVHYLGHVRGATLGEMLGSINVGYRLMHGDHAQSGDIAQAAFVLDVLTFPALHLPAKLVAPNARLGGDPKAILAGRQKLAQSVEYIDKDDFVQIVCRLCGTQYKSGQDPAGQFPARWCTALPEADRSLKELVAYIDEWFPTAEGVSSNQFMVKSKRLTSVLASVLVVLLNLDAIQIATNLYGSGSTRDALAQSAGDILKLAEGTHAADTALPTSRDASLDKVTEGLSTLTSRLNEPDLELGWQQSWIARAWCVNQHVCAPGDVDVPGTRLGWCVHVGLWFCGLLVSFLLLSLGAPFWANQLKELLGWQTLLQTRKVPAPDGTEE